MVDHDSFSPSRGLSLDTALLFPRPWPRVSCQAAIYSGWAKVPLIDISAEATAAWSCLEANKPWVSSKSWIGQEGLVSRERRQLVSAREELIRTVEEADPYTLVISRLGQEGSWFIYHTVISYSLNGRGSWSIQSSNQQVRSGKEVIHTIQSLLSSNQLARHTKEREEWILGMEVEGRNDRPQFIDGKPERPPNYKYMALLCVYQLMEAGVLGGRWTVYVWERSRSFTLSNSESTETTLQRHNLENSKQILP